MEQRIAIELTKDGPFVLRRLKSTDSLAAGDSDQQRGVTKKLPDQLR